ncbi:RHS repeat-associated core domain-containing protein, partial [Lampropedia aestuarii]|uniref:RHS repeat-associated core domain-containing protein n=1 Tax=Lampropedia aestuarii TaxID=2562762 RepID=UPI002468A60B
IQRYQYDAAGQLSAHRDGHAQSPKEHWLYSQYRWSADGQLLQTISSQHSAEGTVQRLQELHYSTGLLSRACSYLQQPGDATPWLQSETLIERDPYGRTSGEVQRLWAQPDSVQTQAQAQTPAMHMGQNQAPQPEHEYHIRHQYDALGNRVRSQHPQLPAIEYLLYGAGHVHGIHLGQHEVLAIERDSLHRETQRRYGNGASQVQSYTPLGQLHQQQWQLPTQQNLTVAEPLIGQIQQRHYHYDALGQISAITHGQHTPYDTYYRYDSQGRLTAAQQRSQSQPHYWRFDAAGNRLPSLGHDRQAQDNWAEQVRVQWSNPHFNPLGQGQMQPNEAVHQWPHNRVAYSEAALYRYDGKGNRTASVQLADGSRHKLYYDSSNQLTAVATFNAQGQRSSVSLYRYDSLGRRVAQTVQRDLVDGQENPQSEPETTYYGWDGDRLTCTQSPHGTTSTIYEPGSFTPLLQLYQRKPQQGDTLSEQQHIFQQVDQQFEAMRGHMKPLDIQRHKSAVLQEVERQLKHLGKWQDDETAANPLQIRYYHCNQIGTPLALSDEQGHIIWAGQYDPWGNLQDEYNADPEAIRQDIRMPGQHHDRVTGLYYNRYRYYDPQLGTYINQDPIGLVGGHNFYHYPLNPLVLIDPVGLFKFYGEWCGPDWTGGREHSYEPNDDPNYYAPPIDRLDEGVCFMIFAIMNAGIKIHAIKMRVENA